MTARTLVAPHAVLFDYGGVISDVAHDDAGFAVVAAQVARAVPDAPPLPDIEADVRAGSRAYESWKQSQSRRLHPREMTHAEFWELVVCDWPAGAREALLSDAATLAALSELFEHATLRRPAKPDSRAVLLAVRERGIRTGLVCNCLSGDAARRQMRADGLAGLFDAELYSDEIGLRKPDPDIILQAVRAVRADPARTWFVGDKYNRDILGARRAHLGAAVLMTSPGGPGTPVRDVQPDAEVGSPTELLALLG